MSVGGSNCVKHNWISGVLLDIESYALKNDLPMLADAIAQVQNVAEAEISAQNDTAPAPTTPQARSRQDRPSQH